MTKLTDLVNWFEGKNKVMIALSGGVDSALVAYAAFQKLGNSAIAVTADYKTLSEEELQTATKPVTRHTVAEEYRKEVQILIVEDYPTNQKVARHHLERAGYHVDLAENAVQLCRGAASGRFESGSQAKRPSGRCPSRRRARATDFSPRSARTRASARSPA